MLHRPGALRSVSEFFAGRRPETVLVCGCSSRRTSSAPTPTPSQVKTHTVVSFQPSAFTGRSLLKEETSLQPCVRAIIRSFPHSFLLRPDKLLKQRGPAASESVRRDADTEGLVVCFIWRIIALQCCGGFCHTSTGIGHRHTHVPSLPPPTP